MIRLDIKMKYWPSAITALILLTPVSAYADCLADKVTISDVELISIADDYLTVSYSILNGLDFPIAGVYIRIKATYPERPSSIVDQAMQKAMLIRGALLPGEKIIFTDYLVTGSRASGFVEDGSKLEFMTSVKNVADKDMVSYHEGALVGGWSPGPSPYKCD